MTEAEAQRWLYQHGWWSGPTGDRLRMLVAMVGEESARQNLVSASSLDAIFSRHIVDSAQLLKLAPDVAGQWLDIGTGAGFPGMVVACLRDEPITMVEVRPKRAAFLSHMVSTLRLGHADVIARKVEAVLPSRGAAAVISARAYAPLERLFPSALHLADLSTVWILPKGRNGEKELASARADWQAVFHVEQSITDAESIIVTATKLQSRVAPPRSPAKRAASQRRRP